MNDSIERKAERVRCWSRWGKSLQDDEPWRGHRWPLAMTPRWRSCADVPRSPENCCPRRSQVVEQRVRCLWITICSRRIFGVHGGALKAHSARDAELLCQAAEFLARASIPEELLRAIRIRMTAVLKPTGGVRGIVAGDIIRRLVSRTIAQQIRRPQHLSNTPCPPQSVSALPMRSRR